MRDTEGADLSAHLQSLIAMRREAVQMPAPSEPEKIPAKLYGIMAVTTVLTFATLVTGYQLLFPPQQLFA
ncbi:hypothetical protein [Sphingomonas daechungensis]|uniref:hypothetical protein n=1 Tax=Sphingomonas daechungensis TaxID=1176646 RepID=UPI003783C08D